MSRHTPGPWHWVNSRSDKPFDFDAIWDGDGTPSLRTIAEHETKNVGLLPDWILDAEPMQNGNDAANARLIAAAPELLAALEACEMRLTHLAQDGAQVTHELKVARAAIAQATGEQS
jgi:hypothetical protein